MELTKLLTYRFAPNVGSADRFFRIVSGLIVAALPWALLSLPGWAAVALTAAGLAWLLTGVVGRCGMYYLLGFSSRRPATET